MSTATSCRHSFDGAPTVAIDLQNEFVGCVLKSQFIGCSRVVTEEQQKRIADLFSANEDSVRANREIILRSHPLVLAVRKPIRRAKRIWADNTIKFEDGVRLVRKKRIKWMREEVAKCKVELEAAVGALIAGWKTIIQDARDRLVDLFEENDYDLELSDAFAINISFPAIEPDKALKELAPELYEAERLKVAARFEAAADAAEAALLDKMRKVLDRLLAKLAPTNEGDKQKKLNQRAVDAIVEFGEHFGELSVGSPDQIKAIVAQAAELAQGIDIRAVNAGNREQINQQFDAISKALDSYVETKPKRQLKIDF